MPKPNRFLIVAVLLLVISMACSAQANTIPTLDPDFISTAIVQTVNAAVTQTAQAVGLLASQTPPTPELPASTPTASPTLTPILSPTPVVPLISVSVATNCRVGPGRVYDLVGALLVGETAEVYGVDPTGNYWYIANPDRPGGFCWLWGEYATVVGNTTVLPVYTPPPTPTPVPAFEAFYAGLEACVGWWVDIELENTGGITFRSVSITLRDTVTDIVLSLNTDGFTDNDGCNNSKTRNVLDPGDARIVSMPAFVYDPTGHKLRATVTLCSNKGLNGTCVTEVIAFTP